jgi:hypothetical protein
VLPLGGQYGNGVLFSITPQGEFRPLVVREIAVLVDSRGVRL